MRRTAIVLLAVSAFLSGCEKPAEKPAAEPTAAAAAPAPPPVMPADAPPQEEVDPAAAAPVVDTRSCLESAGPEASARLVERCRAVSPATRPPCNVVNPCQLIQDEIDRSCEMYAAGETRPAECAA